MTRESIADRLINYADAAAAFSVVNSLAFIVTLSDPEIRCSLASLHWVVSSGQILFSAGIAATVVLLRRAELRLRAEGPATDAQVARHLRTFFVARLAVIAVFTIFTVACAVLALTDPQCAPPGA